MSGRSRQTSKYLKINIHRDALRRADLKPGVSEQKNRDYPDVFIIILHYVDVFFGCRMGVIVKIQ